MGRASGQSAATQAGFSGVFGTRRGALRSDTSPEAVIDRLRAGEIAPAYRQFKQLNVVADGREELFGEIVGWLHARQQERWSRQLEPVLTALGAQPTIEMLGHVWQQTYDWAADQHQFETPDGDELPGEDVAAELDAWMDTWQLTRAIGFEICDAFVRSPGYQQAVFGRERLRSLHARLDEAFPGVPASSRMWNISGLEWADIIAEIGEVMRQAPDGQRFAPGVSDEAVKDALAEGVIRVLQDLHDRGSL